MEIRKVENKEIENIGLNVVFLECVLMPNGELIRFEKSLGFAKDKNKEGIYIKDE